MPKTKHRRKTRGKAVPHPGRSQPVGGFTPLTELKVMGLWRRFTEGYGGAFREQYPDGGPGDAGYLLELIQEKAFVLPGKGSLRPISKAEVFRDFMRPADLEDLEQESALPARDTDIALALLVKHGLIEVDGDTLTVPAHVWDRAARWDSRPRGGS